MALLVNVFFALISATSAQQENVCADGLHACQEPDEASLLQRRVGMPITTERKAKRGLGMHSAQDPNCKDMDELTGVSWYYSWGVRSAFWGGFSMCKDPVAADKKLHDELNIEHVPMFWSKVPESLSEGDNQTLQNAKYVMGFNEPQQSDQAHLSPDEAAVMWPRVMDIASAFDLKIVAPCMKNTGSGSQQWMHDWMAACTKRGFECKFDFTCIHLYYFPMECSGAGCFKQYEGQVSNWYETFSQKQIWITEFACYPWNDEREEKYSKEANQKIMEQMVPVMDKDDRIFRYAWFADRGSDPWYGVLDTLQSVERRKICTDAKWIGNKRWGRIGGFKDCLALAREKSGKCSGTAISFENGGNRNCYCSTGDCSSTKNSWATTVKSVQHEGSKLLSPLGEIYNSI